MRLCLGLLLPLLLLASSDAQEQSPRAASELGGTTWQLVVFLGGDGSKLSPLDKTGYTVTFDAAGSVSVKIDCNRGRGTWKSAGANQLEFGPLALTRAMCPQAPLNDHIPKHWEYVRSYVIKDGHLFLSLMADAGTYEFEPMPRETSLPSLPATFMGTLPCADCPGILYQVNLLPDHTFLSRMIYQERSRHLDDRGRWHITDDGKTLTLRGEHGPARFALADSDTLRMLDSSGHEIPSKLNYDLKRTPTFTAIEAGNPETGQAPLEHTYWKLTILGDTKINAASEKQAAHFILNAETHRVSGAGGCNRLSGSYQIDGEHITFIQMISTMMACVDGMETEKVFRDALSEARTWKITGQQLELFDASGKLRATFESQPM